MQQYNIPVFQQWIGEVMEERDARYYGISRCRIKGMAAGCLVIQSLPQGTSNSPSYPKIVIALSFTDKDCLSASIVRYMSRLD